MRNYLYIAALIFLIILAAIISISNNGSSDPASQPTLQSGMATPDMTPDVSTPAASATSGGITPETTSSGIFLPQVNSDSDSTPEPTPELQEAAREGTARIVGPEEIVFNWSEEACETIDIPDVPARAFRDAQGQIQLISSHYVNRRKIGADLYSLIHECTPVMDSGYNPDPALFSDREWIAATYTPDGVTVYALIHNEYQGHTHPNQCPSGEYRDCWYNSITLAISTDGGATYTHAKPPPQHLVASLPYPYTPGPGPIGHFAPSNILHNPQDGYYYVLIRTENYEEQEWGVCVMRTRDLSDPTAWRAWDGSGFHTRFIDPYRTPDADPAQAVCEPVSRPEIGRMSRNVTYNTYYDQFMLIGAVGQLDSETGATSAGIYFSLSDDLIHWTPRQLIMPAELPWTFVCGDDDPIEYPALLDPDSPARNFDITGRNVYLYFKRFNYEDCRGTINHDLIRIPIEFN